MYRTFVSLFPGCSPLGWIMSLFARLRWPRSGCVCGWSLGVQAGVSACGGLCGTGCCSRFIVYLVSRNNKLRACLLSVLFPCSACSGHPAELGRVPPCLTAGACGGGFQSRPGPCPVVLTTKPAAGEQDHLHCCLFTESLSRAWLIEVF